MNVAQRFKELYNVVRTTSPSEQGGTAQAAAMLVLAEVIQGTSITLDVNAKLSGDVRYPVVVEQR